MKKILLIAFLCFLTACEKDDQPEDDPGNFQTPLPAATTTGANIFACYVDGKAYIAYAKDIVAYNQVFEGRYGISIDGKWSESDYISTISLMSDTAEEIQEGMTYELGKVPPAFSGIDYYAGYVFFRNYNQFGTGRTTDEIHKGELRITQHDIFERILSGTFWFDLKRPDGKVIEIREGRFDVRYN
ncbi:MAG TPA: hypothetical protein VKY33_01965 [Flavobacterium sp.]|nr:hypothetical protein [Flavobacterium sp.]